MSALGHNRTFEVSGLRCLQQPFDEPEAPPTNAMYLRSGAAAGRREEPLSTLSIAGKTQN